MKCWHCGKELRDGQPFCDQCGAEQRHPPDLDDVGREQKDGEPSGGSGWGSTTPPSPSKGLKIAGLVFAVLYTVVAGNSLISIVMQAFGLIGSLFSGYNMLYSMFSLVVALIHTVLTLLVVACFLMLAFRKTEENWDGLMLGLIAILAVRVIVRLIVSLILTLLLHAQILYLGAVLGGFGSMILFGVIAVVTMAAMGVSSGAPLPVIGRDQDALKASLYTALADAQTAAMEVLGALQSKVKSGSKSNGNPPYSAPPPQGQYTYQDQTNQGYPHYEPSDQGRYSYQGQQTPPYTPYQTPYGAAGFRLQEDRNLVKYILLSLVTCGIYSWYFIYCWARDVNIACDGDGKHTGGLLAWILLSTVTCGIYPLYWYYALGNRLQINGQRYGMQIREGGGTILLWTLVGLLTCGLASLYAFYLLLRNTNYICAAYNRSRGM